MFFFLLVLRYWVGWETRKSVTDSGDVAANDHGAVATDEVRKVDQSRSSGRRATQDEQLRPVVFHVVLNVNELLDTRQGLAIGQGLH